MSKAMEANKNNGSQTNETESYSWLEQYDINMSACSSYDNEPFEDDSTPHKPPLIDVDLKLASDIEFLEDEELVGEVVDYWFPESKDRLDQVAAVFFNDGSVWYLPTTDWEKDYEGIRTHVVQKFIPEIIQWRAIVNGENPSEALSRHEQGLEPEEPEWEEDVADTEISEEDRMWFNENVDWLPHLDREIKSKSESIDLNVESGDSWADDW